MLHVTEMLCHEHRVLAGRFKALADARGDLPVFAIEHELDEIAIEALKAGVALQLERDPHLKHASWGWMYLPLLVVATEVGYRYQGTGTEFWPVLSRELRVETGGELRSAVARLFRVGHREFRLFSPGDTAWERHFPNISWPIGNAIVPLEMQPRLTDALRRVIRAGISTEDDDVLLDSLRTLSSGHGSRRFDAWLERSEVALEVMRRLLSPDVDGWLASGFVQRLDRDIRRNVSALRAISEARRIVARRAPTSIQVPSSRYLLRLQDSEPVRLWVRGPLLGNSAREQVIAILRIRGDLLRIVGADRNISLRSFLAGGEVEVGNLLDVLDSPLRRGDANHVEQGLAKTVLDSLQPAQATFFRLEAGGHVAEAVFPGETLATDAEVLQWLRDENGGSQGFRRLSASAGPDAQLLRKRGFTVLDREPSIRIIGLPMPGSDARFAAGFPIMATPHMEGVALQLDGKVPAAEASRSNGSDWEVFRPEPGRHKIGYQGADEAECVAFEVVEPADVEAASVRILPVDATVADLEGGRVEIRITSPVVLEDVPVRLKLEVTGRAEVLVEDRLERVPARIAGRSPIFESLLSQLTGRGSAGVRLRVEVGGLLPASMYIRPLQRDLIFDQLSSLWLNEDGSGTGQPSLVATPKMPLLHTATGAEEGLRLIIPDAPDHEALMAGLILPGKQRLHLGQGSAARVELPRINREAASYGDQAGLGCVLRAAVAWQLAEASDPISDWERRTVIKDLQATAVELLCGSRWRALESRIDLSIRTQIGALLHCAQSHGLVSGDDLPRIDSESDRNFLKGRLAVRLGDLVPDIEDALANWDEGLAGNLDLAVIDAYEDLRRHLLDTDEVAFDEVDMFREAEVWRKALRDAQDIILLPMFRRFITPDARWNALYATWYGDLDEDELVDLIDDCHVDASRRSGVRWIGRRELLAMLQFWLSPQALVGTEEWPALVSRGLSDTRTARSVRYVALRSKLARMDMSDGRVS